MGKFCQNCGTPLKSNEKFCPQCGTQIEKVAQPVPTQSSAPHMQHSGLNKKIIAAVIICLIGFGGAGTYYYINHKTTTPLLKTAETTNKEIASTQSPKKERTPLQIVQQEFDSMGISGKVVATSYGHDKNGCLTLLGGKGYRLAVWDMKNNQVAYVDLSQGLHNLLTKKSGSGSTYVIFNMTILNDSHDNDEKNGEWQGVNHTFPIWAAYKFDAQGNIIPGVIHTAWGLNPSHYQGYLYEQKNVDMVNLVLTELDALHQNILEHNIKL